MPHGSLRRLGLAWRPPPFFAGDKRNKSRRERFLLLLGSAYISAWGPLLEGAGGLSSPRARETDALFFRRRFNFAKTRLFNLHEGTCWALSLAGLGRFWAPELSSRLYEDSFGSFALGEQLLTQRVSRQLPLASSGGCAPSPARGGGWARSARRRERCARPRRGQQP